MGEEMMGLAKIETYVTAVEGNRMGDRSEKIRITASYEAASIASSLTFEVAITQARKFWVGQRLTIAVFLSDPAGPTSGDGETRRGGDD